MTTETITISLADFIAKHGLRMTVSPAARNPNAADDEWARDADHWRCTIMCGRARMIVHFSKGSGHHGEPAELPEVLDSLAMDAAGIVNARDFADWCAEYSYDTDSRKAERTFKACKRQAASLRSLLLDRSGAFEELLFNTERE